MQIQIALPDEIADSLFKKWGNLEYKIMEMIVIQAYQEGTISVGKVKDLLGMETRLEVDAFLQEKGIDLAYDETDFEADQETHQQIRNHDKIKAS